jgi:hypothetical protein
MRFKSSSLGLVFVSFFELKPVDIRLVEGVVGSLGSGYNGSYFLNLISA